MVLTPEAIRFKRLVVGGAVKLRFAYVVTCESWREEAGEVADR